eukprot:XP_001705956.1 Hypothetical protein GL50803_37892 [Giardia lamblia ATCC 50803]
MHKSGFSTGRLCTMLLRSQDSCTFRSEAEDSSH